MVKVHVEENGDEIIINVGDDYCVIEREKREEAIGYDWEGQFADIFRYLTPQNKAKLLTDIRNELANVQA